MAHCGGLSGPITQMATKIFEDQLLKVTSHLLSKRTRHTTIQLAMNEITKKLIAKTLLTKDKS